MSSESEEHQKHERRQELMDRLGEILEREMPSLTVDHDVKEVLCAFNAMSAQLFGIALYECDADRDEVKDISVLTGDCVRSQIVRAYDRENKEPTLKVHSLKIHVMNRMTDDDILSQLPDEMPDDMKQDVLARLKEERKTIIDEREERVKDAEETCH